MKRVAELAVVGAVIGLVLAFLVGGARSPDPCGETTSVTVCPPRPSVDALLVGLPVTGLAIGAVCGWAWDAEHRRTHR